MNAGPHPSSAHRHPELHPGRPLCREDLQNGSMRDAYLKSELADLAWSDAQLKGSLEQTLIGMRAVAGRRGAAHRVGDVWVFAYGSLIWNPLFPVAEKRVARIYGFHRSFCLWSRVGRGTREHPGLVLGLDQGGACTGLALRIDAADVNEELLLLWRREMVTGAYSPTWVRARTPAGAVDAIAFVINRRSHAYAGRLPEQDVAENIRTASGMIGPCSEYLAKTAAGLASHGIRDAALERLAQMCGCASAPA